MNFTISFAVLFLLLPRVFCVTSEELLSNEAWQIPSPPSESRWVEIFNISEAAKTGVAHITILSENMDEARGRAACVVPHLAITINALSSSTTRAVGAGGYHPTQSDDYKKAYAQWKLEEQRGEAVICSIPLNEYLAQRK